MNAETWTGMRGLKIELTNDQIDELLDDRERMVAQFPATEQFLEELHSAYKRARSGDTSAVSYA